MNHLAAEQRGIDPAYRTGGLKPPSACLLASLKPRGKAGADKAGGLKC